MGRSHLRILTDLHRDCDNIISTFLEGMKTCEGKKTRAKVEIRYDHVRIAIKIKVAGRKHCFGRWCFKVSDVFELGFFEKQVNYLQFISTYHVAFDSENESTDAFSDST